MVETGNILMGLHPATLAKPASYGNELIVAKTDRIDNLGNVEGTRYSVLYVYQHVWCICYKFVYWTRVITRHTIRKHEHFYCNNGARRVRKSREEPSVDIVSHKVLAQVFEVVFATLLTGWLAGPINHKQKRKVLVGRASVFVK